MVELSLTFNGVLFVPGAASLSRLKFSCPLPRGTLADHWCLELGEEQVSADLKLSLGSELSKDF